MLVEIDSLPPEQEDGSHIEYKRTLANIDRGRVIKYATQMSWRLFEGFQKLKREEAIYYIGIDDDGSVAGLDADELAVSLEKIDEVATQAQAKISRTQIFSHPEGMVARIDLEREFDTSIPESTVAFVGEPDCGKTTLISALLTGDSDDGGGRLRDRALKHPHEVKSGKTSSITYHLLGFRKARVDPDLARQSWDRIARVSDRLVTIIDLPGDHRFYNTTLFGLMSHHPDRIVLLIDGSRLEITPEAINCIHLCARLQREFAIVVTKTDLIDKKRLQEALLKLHHTLDEEYAYRIMMINRETDLDRYTQRFADQTRHRRVPIFYLSNRTRHNLPLLETWLGQAPSRTAPELVEAPKEFLINGVATVTDVGEIVFGIVLKGVIRVGDRLLVGPIDQRSYIDAVVVSIHRQKIPVDRLDRYSTGSLILKLPSFDKNLLRKKMVLITPVLLSNFVSRFLVAIEKDEYQPWLIPGGQYTVFTGNQIEHVTVSSIEEDDAEILILFKYPKRKSFRYIRHLDRCVIRSPDRTDRLLVGVVFKVHSLLRNR